MFVCLGAHRQTSREADVHSRSGPSVSRLGGAAPEDPEQGQKEAGCAAEAGPRRAGAWLALRPVIVIVDVLACASALTVLDWAAPWKAGGRRAGIRTWWPGPVASVPGVPALSSQLSPVRKTNSAQRHESRWEGTFLRDP